MEPRIEVDKETRLDALVPLERILEMSPLTTQPVAEPVRISA